MPWLSRSLSSRTQPRRTTKRQKTGSASAQTKTEEPTNEVDLFLEDAEKRGKPVLGACLENCEKITIPGHLVVGHPIDLPKPPYPSVARAARASGEVVVQLVIAEDGKVFAAHAVSGHPLLRPAATKAATEARFTPTLLEGKPVAVTGVITYHFVAQ